MHEGQGLLPSKVCYKGLPLTDDGKGRLVGSLLLQGPVAPTDVLIASGIVKVQACVRMGMCTHQVCTMFVFVRELLKTLHMRSAALSS